MYILFVIRLINAGHVTLISPLFVALCALQEPFDLVSLAFWHFVL